MLRRVCVFCGSRPGRRPAFREAAAALGRALGERGLGLVYGGASVGLMGAVADAVLAAGGEVVGVIPESLKMREVAHPGLTELREVDTLHERKAVMADLADAFITLPGAFGTLDELFEVLTWLQLGVHRKPCGLLDVGGYYAGLVALLDGAVEHGFLKPEHRALLVVERDVDTLLDRLAETRLPDVRHWIDPSET